MGKLNPVQYRLVRRVALLAIAAVLLMMIGGCSDGGSSSYSSSSSSRDYSGMSDDEIARDVASQFYYDSEGHLQRK